jgi:hypothetical protein
MKFLACLILAICIYTYYSFAKLLIFFLPQWLGVVIWVLAVATAIYVLTEVATK